MSDAASFSNMVPGFDFLQSLVQNAGAALPHIGQWVAPTLNPEEIEKRIGELRTVQFWLEQNARMLGATIQALEVQRMTLTTLKTMNVQMNDLSESLKIRLPDPVPQPEPEPEEEEEEEEDEEDESEAEIEADQTPAATEGPAAAPPRGKAGAAGAAPSAPPGVPDPMQWWGALTQQFSQLAANAMKDAAKGDFAAAVKASTDAAGQMAQAASGAGARKPDPAPVKAAAKKAGAAKPKAAKKTAAKTAAAKRPAR